MVRHEKINVVEYQRLILRILELRLTLSAVWRFPRVNSHERQVPAGYDKAKAIWFAIKESAVQERELLIDIQEKAKGCKTGRTRERTFHALSTGRSVIV